MQIENVLFSYSAFFPVESSNALYQKIPHANSLRDFLCRFPFTQPTMYRGVSNLQIPDAHILDGKIRP